MKKVIIILAVAAFAVTACDNRQKKIDDKVAEIEKQEQAMLCGGFTEPRAVTEDDLKVFEEAIANYEPSTDSQTKAVYVPTSVSTQVVAGTNYLFECDDNTPGADSKKIQILIYRPLPGEGAPTVKVQNPHR